ncbi:MAG: hypothetical protein ABI876_00350 [Bacteroidota bacterium]
MNSLGIYSNSTACCSNSTLCLAAATSVAIVRYRLLPSFHGAAMADDRGGVSMRGIAATPVRHT